MAEGAENIAKIIVYTSRPYGNGTLVTLEQIIISWKWSMLYFHSSFSTENLSWGPLKGWFLTEWIFINLPTGDEKKTEVQDNNLDPVWNQVTTHHTSKIKIRWAAIHVAAFQCSGFIASPGGTPIWNGQGCSSESLNLTPKRDQSGRGRSLCRPLKE